MVPQKVQDRCRQKKKDSQKYLKQKGRDSQKMFMLKAVGGSVFMLVHLLGRVGGQCAAKGYTADMQVDAGFRGIG